MLDFFYLNYFTHFGKIIIIFIISEFLLLVLHLFFSNDLGLFFLFGLSFFGFNETFHWGLNKSSFCWFFPFDFLVLFLLFFLSFLSPWHDDWENWLFIWNISQSWDSFFHQWLWMSLGLEHILLLVSIHLVLRKVVFSIEETRDLSLTFYLRWIWVDRLLLLVALFSLWIISSSCHNCAAWLGLVSSYFSLTQLTCR